jgi:hypothetical protein
MGIRTRGLDIKAGAAKLKADRAAYRGGARRRPLEPAAGQRPRYVLRSLCGCLPAGLGDRGGR